jgi:hypothetical protein
MISCLGKDRKNKQTTQLAEILDALLTGDGFLRSLAGTCIRSRPLTTHRQSATVSNATIATDIFEPSDILIALTTQLAFHDIIFVEQRGQTSQLILAEVASTPLRIDPGFMAQFAGNLRPYAVQVRQGNRRGAIVRDVNTQHTRHIQRLLLNADQNLPLTLFMTWVAAYNKHHAPPSDDLTALADPLDTGSNFHDITMLLLVAATEQSASV